MRRSLLILMLGLFTIATYAQEPCPDAPAFETDQFFCSEAAWAKIGEDADYLSDLPIYPEDTTYTITWYKDSTLNTKVSSPDNHKLVDGEVFYVTQTNDKGCESDALKVVASIKDCGCIKDPGFENQKGEPSARGYEAHQFPGITEHKTCGQTMYGANPYPLGTLDGYGPQDDATLVTEGMDPPHINSGGTAIRTLQGLTRTNPDNSYSHYGFRLNRGAEYGGPGGTQNITSMDKKFIAGEVFSFSFALILENPGHAYEQQPFAQITLYDKDDNIIQRRCLVSDESDCIFNSDGTGTAQVLYSDWTCLKMNTSDYVGQPVRVEFITAYCTPTQHYAFMYIDDLYAGEDYPGLCDDPSFGYAQISSVLPMENDCFIPEPQGDFEGCGNDQSANIPGFPLEVCGSYRPPVSQGNPPTLDDITLDVIQNGSVVGTVSSATAGNGPNSFCFTVDAADINVQPYGDFSFMINTDFELDCGKPYTFHIDDRRNVGLCPTAGCPDLVHACDDNGNGFSEFDLTDYGDLFYGTQWTSDDVTITYYEGEDDAHDKKNAISDPDSFENTKPYDQTVYLRLDWDVEGAPEDCYYLVPMDLEVQEIPDLLDSDEVTFCDDEEVNYDIQGTPENIEDLDEVTYKWYRDEDQLPYSGGVYHVDKPGTYKVVVSDGNCEAERTIEVKKVALDIDMGDSEIDLCDVDSYKLEPKIKSVGVSDVDLDDLTYEWNTGDTSKDLEVKESGTYTLKITYQDCVYEESVDVLMARKPVIKQIPDFKLCNGDEDQVKINISNVDLDNLHIEWYRDGGKFAEDVTEIAVDHEGTFKVIVGENDYFDFCQEEMTFNVEYYHNKNCIIPQGLSPNNDGKNDFLDLEFLNDQSGIAFIKIYNRYGTEIYSKNNYVDEWHGQSDNGKTLPAGTYYYIIKLKDDSQAIKGYIYLNY